jgi:hypothetical protein
MCFLHSIITCIEVHTGITYAIVVRQSIGMPNMNTGTAPDTSPEALMLSEIALKEKKDTSELEDNVDQFLPERLQAK